MAKSSSLAKVDSRFLKEEGLEIFLGNELLVKGLLETEGGTHLWTGYPGSPVAGFFDTIEAIQEIPKHYGIKAIMAHNEALSVAMVNGSQMLGLRAIAVMKSVGVHVASDALALGNLGGAHPEGGVLIVMGDDPWSDSTQVPADSRYLSKHLFMPVLEPSTAQEMKDWIDLGFKLSRESELYIGYLVTTNQADGGGTVRTKKNHFPRINTDNRVHLETAKVDFENKVLLPPRTWRKEQDLPARYERLWRSAEKYQIDQWFIPQTSTQKFPLVFVSSAIAYTYLQHALSELGLEDQIPILKLGISYPINPAHLDKLASLTDQVIVVEERRGFIEEQLANLANQKELNLQIYGKKFPFQLPGFPEHRGLNPSLVLEHIAHLFQKINHPSLKAQQTKVESELALLEEISAYDLSLTPRTPTFCPGCPHRDSASVLVEIKKDFLNKDYMQKQHRKNAIDLVFHGDTGCYTMLMFEPTKDLMHNYSGMGLGGGTGLGIDPFISNKQVVFMGDSTFFHSGQIAISNSVKNGQDITYIILDNKTTAMTGHQTTPGLEKDILGNDTFTQSIDKIVQAIAEKTQIEIIRVNPEAREQYRALLEETILKDGVKVIVADKECGITFHRRNNQRERREVRQNGFLKTKRFINVTADVCENCLECTLATGCPGLTFTETHLGRKIQTDLSWCVADTACTKIYACPSFEEITIIRHEKPSPKLETLDLENLPLPQIPVFSHSWRAYLAGVGGMGIATSTATLVRAGHREGYRIVFCDKNGLAIRNGGVYSYITYLKEGKNHTSALIPYGKANLILGIDPLEAARGLDPANNQRVGSPQFTTALLNTHKTPTIYTLLGKADFCVSTVEETVKRYTKSDRYFSFNISEISEKYFGTKLYANIIMLGLAFQRGELPLSLPSLEWAIKETMGPAGTDNWKAFNLGRYIVCHHTQLQIKPAKTYHDVITEKSTLLQKQGKKGQQLARTLWGLTTQAIAPLHLDDETLRQLALRIYELLVYENAAYVERYIQAVHTAYHKDSVTHDYALTKAVIWNAFKVMAIKDEIYVAYLLTREEKYQIDNDRYHVDPSRGDKIVYRHLNRPEFVIAGQTIKFKLRSQDWMLRLMRQAKFLRKLLPEWHKQEKQFREWYLNLVYRFAKESSPSSYQNWLEAIRQPEQVTGYREIRYPKMRAAKQRVETLINQTHEISPRSISQG